MGGLVETRSVGAGGAFEFAMYFDHISIRHRFTSCELHQHHNRQWRQIDCIEIQGKSRLQGLRISGLVQGSEVFGHAAPPDAKRLRIIRTCATSTRNAGLPHHRERSSTAFLPQQNCETIFVALFRWCQQIPDSFALLWCLGCLPRRAQRALSLFNFARLPKITASPRMAGCLLAGCKVGAGEERVLAGRRLFEPPCSAL